MIIDKNTLRFLQFRDEVLDVSSHEEKYGIILPPIYKSFLSVFLPYFAHHKVKISENEEFQSFLIPFYSSETSDGMTSDDDELSLDYFRDVNELFSDPRSNKEHLKDLLFIAHHGYSGGLLVGIGEENEDKIYHNTDTTVVTFVANNIFEFLQKCQLAKYDFEEPPIETSKLFRNWGENFWRSRN